MSVSYLLLSCNHYRFVAHAVDSALRQQDPPPMEIIISDDCSEDNTFEIICGITSRYRGPHAVRVRRNERRLGVVRHLNALVNVAHGDLLVVAAGDDIASPVKVRRIYDTWKKTGACLIGCNPEMIDESGRVIGHFGAPDRWTTYWEDIIKAGNANIFVSAFDRAWYAGWGMLPNELPMEDQTLIFRAALTKPNGVVVVEEPLVKYRVHQGGMVSRLAFPRTRADLLYKVQCKRAVYDSWESDLRKARSPHLLPSKKETMLRLLGQRIQCLELMRSCLEDDSEYWARLRGGHASLLCKTVSVIGRLSPGALCWMISAFSLVKRRGSVQRLRERRQCPVE